MVRSGWFGGVDILFIRFKGLVDIIRKAYILMWKTLQVLMEAGMLQAKIKS